MSDTRNKQIVKWTVGVFLMLGLLTVLVLPLFSWQAVTFRVRGQLVGLLPVSEWGFGTISAPGYDPVTKQYGYVRVQRHGVYTTIAFGGSRQPTPEEKADARLEGSGQ